MVWACPRPLTAAPAPHGDAARLAPLHNERSSPATLCLGRRSGTQVLPLPPHHASHDNDNEDDDETVTMTVSMTACVDDDNADDDDADDDDTDDDDADDHDTDDDDADDDADDG